jgi:hypothetical protein
VGWRRKGIITLLGPVSKPECEWYRTCLADITLAGATLDFVRKALPRERHALEKVGVKSCDELSSHKVVQKNTLKAHW